MRSHLPGLFLVLFLMCGHSPRAQMWIPVEDQDIPVMGQRDIIPNAYRTYETDPDDMKHILWSAPHEYAQGIASSNTLLTVGLADGSADIFRIVQYDMMEALLAANFPDIKTFRGRSISNPHRTLRADWTVEGFRAVIREPGRTTYIDSYQRNDQAHRIVYDKGNFASDSFWECGVVTEEIDEEEIDAKRVFGDCDFRSYRLAVAATGEYSNFFGATSPAQSGLVLSQVVTAVNRVNDVYEADLTVRLILIANTTSIFYYDPAGDPYSGSACTQLSQNQTTCDNIIGTANYDVGHVFSVGSGGCAGLGVICSAGNKARGATGLNPPTGDPFYIDYVAHELGHQFGGDHTFNGTAGSCNGNRVAASAYEPGSGTTIMAYAGICSSQNIQSNSDDYFHARSLLQIANKVTSTSCAALITFNNQAPVASNVPNYTIPISTPFVLTAIASDPEGDSLSYCWEEYDLESTSTEPPAANDTDGPMFRSFKATTSPSRYFPRLADLVQNMTSIWEVLPSVSRTMTFRMTVRDYHDIAGCTDEDDVVVTTSSTSGPFLVTSQNSGATWLEGSNQVITWNVANTTASPVSCANVDIWLSTNGGMTYPTLLAMNEPNDGSATIAVPPGTTTTGRIMVRGANNIFFDINNANITIEPGLPNFTLALNPATISECNDGTVQTIVEVGQFMGFMDPVNLAILNLPPGAIAQFNPAVVIPGNTSTLTVSNLAGLFGTYNSTVTGTSTTGTKQTPLTITLLSPPTSNPALISPANNATDVVITPVLDWGTVAGITQFEYQLSYDNSFTTVAASGIVTADQVQITTPLLVAQPYFWRVRSINTCGSNTWSAAFTFTTGSCFSLNSLNVPIIIPTTASTVTSTFDVSINMVISDVNVVNLMGTHSWVDDLKFTLVSPQGTQRLIWDQPCGNHDNFNINFDDEAQNGNWPCPPTDGLTYKPSNTLSVFDGQQAEGIWTLQIQDVANQDGGSLNAWGLKVCGTIGCQLVVNQTSGNGTGSLPAAINCAESGDTIHLSSSLANQTINVGSSPLSINKSLVILADGSNINLTGTGTRIFEVSMGSQVEFKGLTITAGTAMTAGAINNLGSTKLNNVIIKKNTGVSGATLFENKPGSLLTVIGTCMINQ